jgi:hypothetical protein
MIRSALSLAAAATALTALGVPSSTPAAWAFSECDNYNRYRYCRDYVMPCSLDGVNPAYHPSIFGNPAVAWRDYGFIRVRDGTWHVERNCVRGLYHGG